MAGNVCPKCGKAVMTYGRFFREAEPNRVCACGSCGTRLRRSKSVYLLLLLMAVVLAAAAVALVRMAAAGTVSNTVAIVLGAIVFVAAVLVTNYAGYALVGWVAAEEGDSTAS